MDNTVEWSGIGACVAIGITMNTIANRQLLVLRTLEIDFRHRGNKEFVANDSSLITYALDEKIRRYNL
jgi:hypothetical protein